MNSQVLRALGMAAMVSLNDYPDLGERTYQVLKEQILAGLLSPDSRLLVVDLAQQLGVSRTPVKDALNRLSAEGLVVRLPRKGYLVRSIDARDVVELMEARLVVELAAAERGIDQVEASDVGELRRILAEMAQFVAPDGGYSNYLEFLRRDCDLHHVIVGTARNRRLLQVYSELNVHAYMVRMHYAARLAGRMARDVLAEHEAIVAAVEERDLRALRAALTNNIESFLRAFTAVSLSQSAQSSGAAVDDRGPVFTDNDKGRRTYGN